MNKHAKYLPFLLWMGILSLVSSGIPTYTKAPHMLTTDKKKAAEVIFEDHFSIDGIPDRTKWKLAPHTINQSDKISESYNQVYVSGGKLIVKAEGNERKGYKCGAICTKDKFEFMYGRVDVSAKINTMQGAFPAIWMMNERYPEMAGSATNGEIDIMEHVSNNGEVVQTVHTKYTRKNKLPVNQSVTKVDVTRFNLYSMEWTPQSLTFFVNNVQTMKYPNMQLSTDQWPFNQNFYLIINYMLGESWAGEIDDAALPVTMEIDFIKVTRYQCRR